MEMMFVNKEVISNEVIYYIEGYAIVKSKERILDENGKPFGMVVWYDICADSGEGDIVASFKTLKEAREWIKEN